MIVEKLLPDFQLKWKRIQEAMRQCGADGCLLSGGINLFYVTGVMYNGYFYLGVEGNPCFFVKRPNGLSGEQLCYIHKPEQIPDYFAQHDIQMPRKLMLEADELTYSDYMRLLKVFQPEETVNATAVLRTIRRVKTPWEIEQTLLCAERHKEVYSIVPTLYKPGMTDLDFQFEIERVMRQHGSIGLFRAFGANMDIFMGSLLAGENAETPSPFDFALGGAGVNAACPLGANGTLLKEGMAVMVDMAGNYAPYMTDMTRVFSIGKLSDEAYRAHDVSIQIHNKIAQIARPGVPCSELYNVAYQMADEAGFSANFMGTKQQAKFVGHGVGLYINELPVLTPRSKEVLEENMIFALEPKFVLPGIGAVGVENTYLVTADGVRKLTLSPEEIIDLNI